MTKKSPSGQFCQLGDFYSGISLIAVALGNRILEKGNVGRQKGQENEQAADEENQRFGHP